MAMRYDTATTPPPSFAEGRNMRQKVRATGLDPNYWYAVEFADRIQPGQVREVVFWKRSIALFRASNGELHAIENRCAHRQLKLTLGSVEGCRLVCLYHGWSYDGEGRVAGIPHPLFGKAMPQLRVASFPVRVRYGLVWLFPGDPALAEGRTLPDIPELEGPGRWACRPLSFTWTAHHSMIIDNVSDFTHAHLHRKYRPFGDARLLRCETVGDNVHVAYDTEVGRGRISGLFVDHRRINTNHMELCYQYPYQWSNTDDAIKHWLFVLPIDEHRTRMFFLFYFKSFKIPFTGIPIPRGAMDWVLRIANRWLIAPLLDQDRTAVEAEQSAYALHWTAPIAELNPAVRAFQEVTVRKWQAYLDSLDVHPDAARRVPSPSAL
jgi:phenylpropionate dioxygenase-like ring-hydroxylating dioxygenase large terminal subunit